MSESEASESYEGIEIVKQIAPLQTKTSKYNFDDSFGFEIF
jgi:hypothetical protein